MKIIAGLITKRYDGIQATGNVTIGGQAATCGMAGVVFQSFALLDELSPTDNVDFARECAGEAKQGRSASEWLEELQVTTDVPTSRLSGGQRQRLAVARTLAYNPEVILYDEPTSGLDPATGDRVAKLIRETHDHHHKTSVIVTHDYEILLPIADHVFLFDPGSKSIVEIPREQWKDLAQTLGELSLRRDQHVRKVEAVSTGKTVGNGVIRFFERTTNAVLAGGQAVLSLVPYWKSSKWGLRFTRHFAHLVFGPTAILYLLMAGLINGFVTTYFTFQFFPFATYTEPLIIEDLLQAIGFTLYRVFVPILACILVAARCGAAVAADVGGRQYGNQLDAMRTFGAPPRQFLLTPIMLSFLIGTPLLNYVSYYASVLASMLSFTLSHPERGPDFWNHYFFWKVAEGSEWTFLGFHWLIAKLLCSSLGIGAIAYFQGRSPKYSTKDVSRAVTNTILWATLFVLVVHFLFALFEFQQLQVPVRR
ncbi:MAG: ABC transporter permease [Pirellulaceae bacterium]